MLPLCSQITAVTQQRWKVDRQALMAEGNHRCWCVTDTGCESKRDKVKKSTDEAMLQERLTRRANL
jgi:hypothetical protein